MYEYVLCRCHNSKTEILITKNQIKLKLAAGGFLSDVDMRKYFTTFILNTSARTKVGSFDAQLMKMKPPNHKKSSSFKVKNKIWGFDHADDHVQWQTETSWEEPQKRMKEQLSDMTADMVLLEDYAQPCKSKLGLEKHLKEYLKQGCPGSQLKTYLASCSLTISVQELVDALFEAVFDVVQTCFAKEVKEYIELP